MPALLKTGTCVWVLPIRYWEGDPLTQVELVEDWKRGDKFVYALSPDEDSPYYLEIRNRVFVDRKDAVKCREGLKLMRDATIGNEVVLLIRRLIANK